MSYLLDTCILSECVKKTPNLAVVQWINQQKAECLFVSQISMAEIKKGLHKIKEIQPERHQKLQQWLYGIEALFSSRILPITETILNEWAEITAHAELQGKKLAVMDSLIAAMAHQHKLILVTRNVNDFKMTPVQILNPFVMS
ncbi:MAG: type II toxin-antitoxin system VapC family toxin [Thiotrichaceae bacterium]|nr:type II toxin-antitoxin system VapC family toxin [Thiotrichaceae bacterium]